MTSRGARLVQGGSDRLLRWGRRVAATRLGGRAGALAYEGLARRAARQLIAIEGVRAVWVTGSVAERRPSPGWSDIDLLLETVPLSLDDELRLRGRLLRWMARAPRWIRHLDYAPADELHRLMRWGDAWASNVRRTARLLEGEGGPWPPSSYDRDVLRVLQVGKTLERYAKTLPFVAAADPRTARQAARRLWRAVMVLTGPEPRRAPRRDTASLLDDATRLLEAEVSTIAASWSPARSSSSAPSSSSSRDLPSIEASLLKAAEREGVVLRALAWRSTPTAWLWIHDDVSALQRAAARSAYEGELLFLTPHLAEGARLLDPAPLVGVGAPAAGTSTVVVREPPATLMRTLATASLARLGLQGRGRALRTSSDEALARRRLEDDVLLRGPALEAVVSGEEIPAADRPSSSLDEQGLLARLRDDQARRFAALEDGAP